MKKISIVTLMAALVLLSGCNKEYSFDNSVDLNVNNSTEMPIKLGANTGSTSAMTRASIESLDEMLGTTDRLGVFCLAGRKTDVKSALTANPIDWLVPVYTDDNADYVDKYGASTNGRYWSNLCCEVQMLDGMHRIVPVQEGANNYKPYYKYYPITSVYGYDFYSYYPYQGDAAVHYTKDSICVDMTIGGKQDVIYGKSEDIDDAYVATLTSDYDLQKILKASYYSARFFRKHPQQIDNAHIKLEHKLARFRFYVYPGPDYESSETPTYSSATQLCVQEIKVNNVQKDLSLVVAHKNDKKRNGALYARNNNVADFYLHHKGGALLEDAPVEISTKEDEYGVTIPDTTQVGDYIMLLPGKSIHYMSIKLADKGTGYVYPSETDIAISFKNGSNKTFEAGKTYNVYLQVSSIKNIGLTAELADWEESGEDMDLVEFN